MVDGKWFSEVESPGSLRLGWRPGAGGPIIDRAGGRASGPDATFAELVDS